MAILINYKRIMIRLGLLALILAAFLFIFSTKASAATQGFGWAWPTGPLGGACGNGMGQYRLYLVNESGAQLSGGNILITVPGQGTWGDWINPSNPTTTGCIPTNSGFIVQARAAGMMDFYSEFTLMPSIQAASVNQLYRINVYMTTRPSIEIISPTGGQFTSSPNITVRTSQGPSALNPGCVLNLWAQVDGSWRIVASNIGFGDSVFNFNFGVGIHTISFEYTACAPYPVSAKAGPVQIEIVQPPQGGIVVGRVWRDDNGNGAREGSEPWIEGWSIVCSNSVWVNDVWVNWRDNLGGSGAWYLNFCNTDAFYISNNDPSNPFIPSGRSYTVSVNLPAGWQVTNTIQSSNGFPNWTLNSDRSLTGVLQNGEVRDIHFGIRQRPKDFEIIITPSFRSIDQGQATTYSVTVRSYGGFTGNVQLYGSYYLISLDALRDTNNFLNWNCAETGTPPTNICRYNKADVNRDGYVELVDLQTISQGPWWNQTCSVYAPNPYSYQRYLCNRADVDRNGRTSLADISGDLVYQDKDISTVHGITVSMPGGSAPRRGKMLGTVFVPANGTSGSVEMVVQTSSTTPVGNYWIRATGVYENNTVNLEGGPERVDHSFLTVNLAARKPWIKTTGGTMTTLGRFSFQEAPPPGQWNAQYLATAGSSSPSTGYTFLNWFLQGYSPTGEGLKKSYLQYLDLYNPPNPVSFSGIPCSGIIRIGSSFTLSGSSAEIGNNCSAANTGPTVVFVDGNMTISANLPFNRSVVFFISGDLRVSSTGIIDEIRGYYVVDGLFDSNPGGHRQLKVFGGVLANSHQLRRDLLLENLLYPSERFDYDPSVLWHMRGMLGRSTTTYRELAP